MVGVDTNHYSNEISQQELRKDDFFVGSIFPRPFERSEKSFFEVLSTPTTRVTHGNPTMKAKFDELSGS